MLEIIKMNGINNLKRTVYILIFLSILSFLAGFLQSTKYEFIIYVFYLILSAVGIKLILYTIKLKGLNGLKSLKVFLLISGFTSTIYFLFFVFAVLGSIFFKVSYLEILTESEGFLYFNSILFLIGCIVSIVLLKRKFKMENKR